MSNPNLVDAQAQTRREGVTTSQTPEVDSLLLDVSDADLLEEIEDRLKSAEVDMNKVREVQKINEDYYNGDQLKRIDLLTWQTPVIENRIFLSTETLIPMITAQPGDPDIKTLVTAPPKVEPVVDPNNPQSEQVDEGNTDFTEEALGNYVMTLQNTLLFDYVVIHNLQEKLRVMLRHWFNYRYGVGKFRLDPSTNKIVFEVVNPKNLILPGKTSPKGWKAEYKEDTIKDLLVMFPKAKDKIAEMAGGYKGEIPKEVMGTKLGYYEYWRPTFVAWKMGDQILDKRKNPYWDWKGEDRVVGQQPSITKSGRVVAKPVVENFRFNILSEPRDPYFIYNYFKINGTEFDDTGLFEQARPLQDMLNKRKRQISSTLDDSGILIGSGETGMTQEEFAKYDGSPRSKIYVPKGNPNTLFARLTGGSLPAEAINDLNDTRQAIDNIFGTQSVTRGQQDGANQSGVARNILRQGDISRSGPLSERIEDILQEIYMYDLQMRMLFTTEDYVVPTSTSVTMKDDAENFTFNRNKVPMIKVKRSITVDGVKSDEEYFTPIPITLTVRRNSTIAKDPVSEYQRDETAFKEGLIDPLTFFERTNQVNPHQKLERLFRWHNFPITMLDEDTQKELMPLMQNPISPPPNRTIRENLDIKDLPPTAQMGVFQEAGLIKNEQEAVQTMAELQQMKLNQPQPTPTQKTAPQPKSKGKK